MYEVIVYGQASKKIVKKILVNKVELTKNLMNFLRENSLPIASSCIGKGQCEKCVVNDGILSCGVSLLNVLESQKDSASHHCAANEIHITVCYL